MTRFFRSLANAVFSRHGRLIGLAALAGAALVMPNKASANALDWGWGYGFPGQPSEPVGQEVYTPKCTSCEHREKEAPEIIVIQVPAPLPVPEQPKKAKPLPRKKRHPRAQRVCPPCPKCPTPPAANARCCCVPCPPAPAK
jgi:hypothetical protein